MTKTIAQLNGGTSRAPVYANTPLIPYAEGSADYPMTIPQLRAAMFRGALVYKGSDQLAANYTTATALTFDTEAYDTDAIHSTSSNTSRLTVPSGVSYVRLVGSCVINNNSGTWTDLAIWKNAGFAYAGWTALRFNGPNGGWNMAISSPVQAVTAGDYFELFLTTVTDTSVDVVGTRTWFAMEIIA